ncbi:uncharacterized protein LOC143728992 [Siphateles boraxobius]|uniref:uncharacterized protein LOC143728992 n=1 Tax=Siphateles boraxobius TaxID=180520 RepID=UPI004063A340
MVKTERVSNGKQGRTEKAETNQVDRQRAEACSKNQSPINNPDWTRHNVVSNGTSANSLNFQLYLLEGLNRWNQDREAASLAVRPPSLLSYSGDIVHCVNNYSVKVLGRKLVPSFQPPAVYTGELIGIDYLYRQTGTALQDVQPDSEETEQMLEDVGTEEELEDEGFEDAGLDPTVELLDPSSVTSPATTSSAVIPTPTCLQATAGPAGTSGPASVALKATNEYSIFQIVHACTGSSAASPSSSLPSPVNHAAPQQLASLL